MNLDSALKKIRKDLSPELQGASARLVEYVFLHKKEIKHLSYTRIAQIIETQEPSVLLAVVQYCAGARLGLLDMRFELILNDSVFELDNSDVHDAENGGVLIHPETGDPVENYERHVYPFFVPSSLVGHDERA